MRTFTEREHVQPRVQRHGGSGGYSCRAAPRNGLARSGKAYPLCRNLQEEYHHAWEARAGKQFFFEKKNQKTFASWAYAGVENRDSDIIVRGSGSAFSSEKKRSSSAMGTICWIMTTSFLRASAPSFVCTSIAKSSYTTHSSTILPSIMWKWLIPITNRRCPVGEPSVP